MAQKNYKIQSLPDVHRGAITHLLFHPNDTLLAVASRDGCTSIWDSQKLTCLIVLQQYMTGITAVDFHPNGELLVSGSEDNQLKIWQVGTGKCVKTITVEKGGIWQVFFSRNGKQLIYCNARIRNDGRILAQDNEIWIWDIETEQCLQTLKKHCKDNMHILSWTYSPQRNIVAIAYRAGSDQYPIHVWDLTTTELLYIIDSQDIRAVGMRFNTTGDFLASSHRYAGYGEIAIWDLTGNKAKLEKKIHQEEHAFGISFSQDSRYLIASGGFHYNTVAVWDIEKKQCAYRFPGHGGGVYTSAINSNGSQIAFCSNNPADHISISENFTIKICSLITKNKYI